MQISERKVGPVTVIDLNGPGPEDDTLISQDITFAGPHGEAEGGFTLFCEVITDVLG